MSKVPKVQEIFSNPALGKNNAFVFTEQETKQQIQLSKKKAGNGQMPIMKKFGGYKPKILGGETDFLALQKDTTLDSLNQESRTNRLLTKPQPWIIGDKNVPMVLGSVHDDDDDDDIDENGNNHENEDIEKRKNGEIYSMNYSSEDRVNDIGNSLRTHSISSETSTLISSHSNERIQGFDNPALRASSSMSDTMSTGGQEVVTENPIFTHGSSHEPEEQGGEIQEGVYIPAPDYDEEERTIDFNSEDTDDPDSNEESQKPKQPKAKPLGKVYGGEDLSHYLTDDEVDENEVELRSNQKSQKGSSTLGRKSNSDLGPKVSQKHSLFKQQSQQSKNKRNSGKVTSPGFNSVRSFSYADSKFGTTKNKSGSKHNLSFSELTDDSETFLSTNTHQSSYESFLRSRNGDAIPSTDLNDSGVEMGEDGTFSQRKSKDETLWKKMTLRLKHKISKKGSAVKEH
ncbi:unnamed protein product [Lymnaea stagnalis]|uniref:Uncharacterized protein n=1 Tax=Lymnaea stagnalis TaxID=6523 RepID=A0AAV2INF0_LYMST